MVDGCVCSRWNPFISQINKLEMTNKSNQRNWIKKEFHLHVCRFILTFLYFGVQSSQQENWSCYFSLLTIWSFCKVKKNCWYLLIWHFVYDLFDRDQGCSSIKANFCHLIGLSFSITARYVYLLRQKTLIKSYQMDFWLIFRTLFYVILVYLVTLML